MDAAPFKKRIQILSRRFFHRTKILANFYFNRSEKEPIFIISAARTGSTLMLSYLNSIPSISFIGKILQPDHYTGLRRYGISKRSVLRHLVYSINHTRFKICGAKLLHSQLEIHKLNLEDIKDKIPNAKFVILYRESLFDQFVSNQIANMTNRWVWTPDFQLPPFVFVEPSHLLEFCSEVKRNYGEVLKNVWLGSCSVILSYETLISDPQGVFDETIFPFLGLSSVPISTPMRKQNTKKPEDLIINYQDLKPLLHDPRLYLTDLRHALVQA